MVIVLDEGKLGIVKTAKVVDPSERALPEHVLEEDLPCERIRNSEHLPPLRRQFANGRNRTLSAHQTTGRQGFLPI
jgi:hypothetical protein